MLGGEVGHVWGGEVGHVSGGGLEVVSGGELGQALGRAPPLELPP